MRFSSDDCTAEWTAIVVSFLFKLMDEISLGKAVDPAKAGQYAYVEKLVLWQLEEAIIDVKYLCEQVAQHLRRACNIPSVLLK